MHLAPYDGLQFKRELNQLLQQLSKQQNLIERLNFSSQYFMTRSYLNGALGEGGKGYFDQSPLYRTDAFDCVTYVNTVLALARAYAWDDFKSQLKAINYYQAQPQYQYRFHFMCVDWNRMNAAQGLVRDITIQLVNQHGQSIAQWAEAQIDRPNWLRQRQLNDIKLLAPISLEQIQNRLHELRELALQQEAVYSRLAYIPLRELFDAAGNAQQQLFEQIPHGAIIEIVRPNWDLRQQIGTHLNVSHVGFAFWQQQQLIFRHATLELGRVAEISLIDYLARFLGSPTIKGINIQQVIC